MPAEKPTRPAESVHDFLGQPHKSLDAFFAPQNVAVIGATETPGSVGRTLIRNLVNTPFGGTVFPVNPKRSGILGIKSYPSIKEIPAKVDLVVVVTPAPTVPGIIRESVEAGVRNAIVISAGFKETGAAGAALETQMLAEARRGKMRIIGPNCLGVMNPRNGFNATFAASMALPGHVAFISQSGALLTAILDWSLAEKVGFSSFVSVGSMLDVGWGDLIDYLGDDPQTQSIVIYMETIGDARAFLSAAREVALNKPIIVIKPGRTEGAAKAAASHTGSLTGSDEVLEAAFRRCGVLRVNRIEDLFNMAEILSKQPRPKGPRLTIVTNAGGPGVLATDALLATGGQLTTVSKEAISRLSEVLPPAWSHGNPVDVLGDAGPERYAKALEVAAQDPASDGLLVILTPQAMTDATQTAEALRPLARSTGKPVLASWMGGESVQAGARILRDAGIPDFSYPDAAARAFSYMWGYAENLRALYETPEPAAIADESTDYIQRARDLLQKTLDAGRTLLSETEAKAVLATYGIPVVETHIAPNETEAVKAATQMGYPVVLKLHSETITHKTDVGGVKLNLVSSDDVRTAFREIRKGVPEKDFGGVSVQPMIRLKDSYELILGSSIDPQFGPVLLFGTGGQLVEVFKDRALGLPPLNTTLARRLMERTAIFQALKGVRGRKAVDLKALEQVLIRFAQLVIDLPRIKEIDINPLLVSASGMVALDARIVLFEKRIAEADLPKTAIRPYPIHYVSSWKIPKGGKVTIRPIRQQDEPLFVKFHEALSERSVYLRYFQSLKLSERIRHERLIRRCFIDYHREIALIAESGAVKEKEMLGIARLIREHGAADQAEFSIVVSDKMHRKGLGQTLMQRLLDVARAEKIRVVRADVLRENIPMLKLCERLGFLFTDSPGEPTIRVELTL